MVRTHASLVASEIEWSSIAVREGRSLSAETRRRIRRREERYINRWADVIDRHVGGVLGPEELRTAAYSVVGLLNSLVQWPPGSIDAPHVEDQLLAMAMGAVNALVTAPERASSPG